MAKVLTYDYILLILIKRISRMISIKTNYLMTKEMTNHFSYHMSQS